MVLLHLPGVMQQVMLLRSKPLPKHARFSLCGEMYCVLWITERFADLTSPPLVLGRLLSSQFSFGDHPVYHPMGVMLVHPVKRYTADIRYPEDGMEEKHLL